MAKQDGLTRRGALRAGATAAGLLGVGTGVGAARPAESPYYQLDFVVGGPIGTLGETEGHFYGRQNRLVGYAHVDERSDEVVERDEWINSLDPDTRACLSYVDIRTGRIPEEPASVRFEVDEGCELTLSFALYPLVDGEFSFEAEQELIAAQTSTFGPGNHALLVGFPGGTEVVAPAARVDGDSGFSAALRGSTLFVGVPALYMDGVAGAVEVFTEADDGWTPSRKLVDPSSADESGRGSRFGWALAAADDTVVVSAPNDDNERGEGAGAVYVYERGRETGTWARRQTLLPDPPDGPGGVYGGFGWAVDLDGDTMLVSGPRQGNARPAYIYESGTDGWERTATLAPAEGFFQGAAARFGNAVAVSDGTAVMGVTGDLVRRGAAYVFERSAGWAQTAKLSPPSLDPQDSFGRSVAVDGDRIAVGASGDDDEGSEAGAVYAYERTDGGWTRTAKLTAATAKSLGSRVALEDDRILTESHLFETISAGSVLLFENRGGSWVQSARFAPGRAGFVGRSVVLDGDWAAFNARDFGRSVYVTEL